MAINILYDFPVKIGSYDFMLDIVIADIGDRYDFPLILGRRFFAQSSLILDLNKGKP